MFKKFSRWYKKHSARIELEFYALVLIIGVILFILGFYLQLASLHNVDLAVNMLIVTDVKTFYEGEDIYAVDASTGERFAKTYADGYVISMTNLFKLAPVLIFIGAVFFGTSLEFLYLKIKQRENK